MTETALLAILDSVITLTSAGLRYADLRSDIASAQSSGKTERDIAR